MSQGGRRYYCAAEGCFADVKKLGNYGYMSSISFFPFPTKKKAPKARKKWLELLRRENYDPPRHHRVCSRHFVDGHPSETNPYPTLFAYNNFKESRTPRSSSVVEKRESANASCHASSQASCRGTETNTDHILQEQSPFHVDSFCARAFEFATDCESQSLAVVREEVVVTDDHHDDSEANIPLDHQYCSSKQREEMTESPKVDSEVQTDLTMEDIDQLLLEKGRLEDTDRLMRDLFIEKITKSDETVMKYTGVPSKEMLNGYFEIMDNASPTLKYWSGQCSAAETAYQQYPSMKKSGPQRKLTRYQEFILTLVRLRLAVCTFFLADIFGISSSRVSQICITWINFMYCVVAPLLKWPSSTVVKKFMPKCFKLTYPDTVCIIDCTEIFISKPRNPTAQSLTYSNYKHHNTYKALVGITPSGAFSFVSKLWGGNTSDRHITKECGFLEFVKPGDQIMADRGFLIRDLLLERRAKLVIPPFTQKCSWGKGKRLASHDIIKTRNIARLRIHVERAIERLKNFHILSNTMPLSLKSVANQILTICAFMCNMQKPLVK